ncbi:hypothetical protein DFH09DRAFT_1330435 [Mycena vulgaris]|nr:hypothetical protein DFH09DRAFT_1330435 [Mycena vulgaris]
MVLTPERAHRSAEARSGVGTERAHAGVAIRVQHEDVRGACTYGFGRLEYPCVLPSSVLPFFVTDYAGMNVRERTKDDRGGGAGLECAFATELVQGVEHPPVFPSHSPRPILTPFLGARARDRSHKFKAWPIQLYYWDSLNNTILVFAFGYSFVYDFCDAFRRGADSPSSNSARLCASKVRWMRAYILTFLVPTNPWKLNGYGTPKISAITPHGEDRERISCAAPVYGLDSGRAQFPVRDS